MSRRRLDPLNVPTGDVDLEEKVEGLTSSPVSRRSLPPLEYSNQYTHQGHWVNLSPQARLAAEHEYLYYQRQSPVRSPFHGFPYIPERQTDDEGLNPYNHYNEKGPRRLRQPVRENEVAKITGNNTISVIALFNRSAVIIQRAIRKSLTRKAARDRLWIEQRRVAFDVVDDLLTEYLSEHFIPDILIDIFTTEDDEYTSEPIEEQIAYEAYEEIKNEAVADILPDLVQTITTQLVEQYLRQKVDTSGENPMKTLVDRLVNSWLHELTREVALEVISELVSEFLLAHEYQKFIDSSIQPLLYRIASELLDDWNLESVLDTLITDVLDEDLNSLALEVWREERNANQRVKDQMEFKLISEYSTKMIDNVSFRLLLKLMASRGDRIIFKEASEHMLEELMARRLVVLLNEREKATSRLKETDVLLTCHTRCVERAGFQLLSARLHGQLKRHERKIQEKEDS